MAEGDEARIGLSGQPVRMGRRGLPVADGPCRWPGCKLRPDPAPSVMTVDPEAYRGLPGNDLIAGYLNNHPCHYFVDIPRGVTEVVILGGGGREGVRFFKPACRAQLFVLVRPEVWDLLTADEREELNEQSRRASWRKDDVYSPCNELELEQSGG